MYIIESWRDYTLFFLFLYINKGKYPKRRMRSRIVDALTNFHAKEFSRLSASSHASFREGRVLAFVFMRTRPRLFHARKTRRRVEYTLLTPQVPSINTRYPAVRDRKTFFSTPYVATHARARTHRRRRRRIVVGSSRARESLLHTLKS